MKKAILISSFAVIALVSFRCATPSANHPSENQTMDTLNFYDLSIRSLDGKSTINFSDFKGKKVLCVNVASECGYTYQYEGLEELHKKYGEKLVVIGFPCNQFGGQEPGAPEEIETFCKKNYGVSFLMTEKIDVKGENQHAIYQWLTQKSQNRVGDYAIKWNFNKFMIDEQGKLIAWFESGVKPMDEEITSLLK